MLVLLVQSIGVFIFSVVTPLLRIVGRLLVFFCQKFFPQVTLEAQAKAGRYRPFCSQVTSFYPWSALQLLWQFCIACARSRPSQAKSHISNKSSHYTESGETYADIFSVSELARIHWMTCLSVTAKSIVTTPYLFCVAIYHSRSELPKCFVLMVRCPSTCSSKGRTNGSH